MINRYVFSFQGFELKKLYKFLKTKQSDNFEIKI